MGSPLEGGQAGRAAVVLAPARGYQGDPAHSTRAPEQRAAGDVGASTPPPADGILAGPALQAPQGRQGRQGWREGERFYYPGPHTELTADAGIYIPIATHMTPCLCPFTVDRPFLRDTSQRGACASHVLLLLPPLSTCRTILSVLPVFPFVCCVLNG
jgi:hypothetical protein